MAYEVKIADSLAEKEDAWRLRFKVFHEKQKIVSDFGPYNLDIDYYDSRDSTKIFVGYMGGKPICTMRVNFQDPEIAKEKGTYFGFPLEEDYVLDSFKKVEGKVAQISRIVALEKHGRGIPIMKLSADIAKYCLDRGIEHLVGGIGLETGDFDEAMEVYYKLIYGKDMFDKEFEIQPREPVVYQKDHIRSIRNSEGNVRLSDIINLSIGSGCKIIGVPTLYKPFKMYHLADNWFIKDFPYASEKMKRFLEKVMN